MENTERRTDFAEETVSMSAFRKYPGFSIGKIKKTPDGSIRRLSMVENGAHF